MVSIILVSFNKWEVTKACVESIQASVRMPYEVIVIDNASAPETVDALHKLPGIRLICNTVNAGFPAACNTGLREAKGNLIWFLNNDTLVPPHSLERMAELLISDPKIGMVGPVTNYISGIQQIPVTYKSDSGVNDFAAEIALHYKGQFRRVLRLVGFSMLIRKSTLDELGGFDERMGIGTFEDDDLSLRLISYGYRLYVALDAFIHHIGGASFQAAGLSTTAGDENQQIVSTTFGLTIPDETMLNEALLSRIRQKAKVILHVECGAGSLGLALTEAGKAVFGLESDIRKGRLARDHYCAFHTYAAGQDFSLPCGFDGFDALVVEQQLDHETSLSILRSVRPALQPGAQVILQVPKIVAVHEGVLNTYMDRWAPGIGHYSTRGKFNIQFFLDRMASLGFQPVQMELEDVRQSFFNCCSFVRHKQTWRKTEYDLPFFQAWMVEFSFAYRAC